MGLMDTLKGMISRHPDKAGQAAMGAALASHLKSVLGW